MKKMIKTYYHIGILCLITILVAAYSPLNPFFDKAITTDQAVFFTIAEGLLDGKLAYVDFFDHKGPLLYMILALGLLIPGDMIGNFLIEIAVIYVSAFLMYKIAHLFAPRWISLLSVAVVFCSDITLFTTANSEEYIFPLLCASVYLFLLQIKNGIDRKQVFIIGLCGMLVFFLKYNYCLIWAALGVFLFVWMMFQRENIIDVLKMCCSFFVGMFVAVLPFFIYLIGTGSFDEFMDVYVLYSLHYAEFTGLDARVNSIRFLLDTPISVFFYIAILTCIFYGIYNLIKKNKNLLGITNEQFVMTTAFTLLSVTILLVTASPGQSWYYYKQATMIIYIVPIALIVAMLYTLLNKKINSIVCGAILCLLLVISIHTRLTPAWYQITTDYRFASAMTICDLIDEVCDEDDTMISFTNDCTMYFYSECDAASRIFFPSAAVVDAALFDELMSDVIKNEPKIITYQSDWEAGLTEQMQAEAIKYTAENYSLIHEDEFRRVYLRN